MGSFCSLNNILEEVPEENVNDSSQSLNKRFSEKQRNYSAVIEEIKESS